MRQAHVAHLDRRLRVGQGRRQRFHLTDVVCALLGIDPAPAFLLQRSQETAHRQAHDEARHHEEQQADGVRGPFERHRLDGGHEQAPGQDDAREDGHDARTHAAEPCRGDDRDGEDGQWKPSVEHGPKAQLHRGGRSARQDRNDVGGDGSIPATVARHKHLHLRRTNNRRRIPGEHTCRERLNVVHATV